MDDRVIVEVDEADEDLFQDHAGFFFGESLLLV